jgi:uncharacterized membrane protein
VKYLKSLAELAALTYAVSLLGLLTANGFDVTDLAAVKAASVAAFPAVLAVLYGAAVKALGNRNSALAVDTRDDLGE